MKINKKKLSGLFLSGALLTCSILSVGGITLSAVSASHTVIEDKFFVDDSGNYKCYAMTVDESELIPVEESEVSSEESIQNRFNDGEVIQRKAVAIAWNKDASATDDNLEVPATVTYGGETYDVRGLAKGAFRYCDFTTIDFLGDIVEIRAEAFAYCENLETFKFPFNIREIAPSTFLDCRNLTSLSFSDENGNRKLGNSAIRSIGDHAFDSCVKLSKFYCPYSVSSFGESCFQKCESLTNFSFPGSDDVASITVGKFAFADCIHLISIYFEDNLTNFGDYAFADCSADLVLSHYGESEFNYSTFWRHRYLNETKASAITANVYPIHELDAKKVVDNDYPGLTFHITTSPLKLDSAGARDTGVYLLGSANTSTTQYVVIDGFEEPDYQENYYDLVDVNNTPSDTSDDIVVLEIPNTIKSVPVKVIGANAFGNNTNVQKVIFNKNLVQIQNHAFYQCSNIRELDFTTKKCDNLLEISYEIFTEKWCNDSTKNNYNNYSYLNNYNNYVTDINLPYSLKYIGDYAFFNFLNISGSLTFDANSDYVENGVPKKHPSELLLIGDFAFAINRNIKGTITKLTGNTPTYNESIASNPQIDLVFPKSLDDNEMVTAKFAHYGNTQWSKVEDDRWAIGRNAFANQWQIRSVTMEAIKESDSNEIKNKTVSIAQNAFIARNSKANMIYFMSNANLFLIGGDSFKDQSNLKELFLHTEKAEANKATYNLPWGIENTGTKYYDTPFSAVTTNARPDLVIYLSGPSAPGDLDDPSKYPSTGGDSGNFNMWNSDTSKTFENELEYKNDATYINNRSHAPTFYNVNWESTGSLIYFKANKSTFATCSRPSSAAHYKLGIMTIIKIEDGIENSKNYLVSHYYTDGTNDNFKDEIDFDKIATTLNITITEIGEDSFAYESKKSGAYFILPTTVTKIGERAFYRKGDKAYAVRIVTYVTGGSYNPSTGADTRTFALPNTSNVENNDKTKTYANYVSNTSGGNSYGYCCLPSGVKYIGRNAFYNNLFKYVQINATDLDYFGSSAFYVHRAISQIVNIDYTSAEGAKFTMENGGLYYVGNSAKKTLVYQTAGTKKVNNEAVLTVADDTKAIGFRSVNNSNYTKVVLNDGLYTIYGSSFQKSTQLKEVSGDGLADVKYISAFAKSGEEIYTNDLPFDNFDFRDTCYSDSKQITSGRYGAFKGCTGLVTLDFTQMETLYDIGFDSFNGCSALSDMTGNSTSYVFYTGTPGNRAEVTSSTTIKDDRTDKKKGVLDLRDCTSLTYIHNQAFSGCTGIKFAILPNTTGDNHKAESKLYYGPDGTPLPSDTKILVGETAYQADRYSGTASNRTTHYKSLPTNYDSPNITNVYYRWYWNEDVNTYTVGGTNQESQKYWTIYNGDYYLLTGRSGVQAFYDWCQANPQASFNNPSNAVVMDDSMIKSSSTYLYWPKNEDSNWTKVYSDNTYKIPAISD